MLFKGKNNCRRTLGCKEKNSIEAICEDQEQIGVEAAYDREDEDSIEAVSQDDEQIGVEAACHRDGEDSIPKASEGEEDCSPVQ